MDTGTSPLENARSTDHAPGPGQGPDPCAGPPPQGGKVVELARSLIRTIRHFFPDLNAEFQALPDSRFRPMVTYDARFLCWWGLLLFLLKLGSRRQLDYLLRDDELRVLENVNRLAGTEQTSLPVNQTLSHFLGHVGSGPLAELRTRLLRRLIRHKVLDFTRLSGAFVIAVDGTGFLSFGERHCDHCLVHEHESHTVYLQPVLEAKLVAPEGLALSIGSEFIENPTPAGPGAQPESLSAYEKVKQDCELKAFPRLAAQLKEAFPQTRLCLAGDSLLACGPVFAECARRQWLYVLTLKQGRTPVLWAEFQSLLELSPGNRLVVHRPKENLRQTFRWVNDLEHTDTEGRVHQVHALLCEERGPDGTTTTFAWVTNLRVDPNNVEAIAARGGRARWGIENQGFNIQKNSGLNLEHAYSTDPDVMKAFYYLLQIAHLFLQMFEMGSLLRQLAKRYQSTPIKLFGSLKNIAKNLLDGFRYFPLGEETFRSGPGQIRLCDSG
jgi:hypothetical protein